LLPAKANTQKKNAKKEGTGTKAKYELVEGIAKGKEFKGTGKAASLHTPKLKSEIKCTSNSDKGKLETPKKEGKIFSVFTGCATLGKKCHSTGAKVGEIKTKELEAVLGYINESKHEVGADIKSQKGGPLAEFECEGLQVVTTGSVIGKVTPVNTFTKSITLLLAVNASGEQEIKKLEGEPNDVLFSTIGGEGPFESGQQDTVVNKGEELEIKA